MTASILAMVWSRDENVWTYGLGSNGCFSGARIAWAGLGWLLHPYLGYTPFFPRNSWAAWVVGTRRGQGTPVEPRRGIAGDGRMAETDCRGTPARGRTLATTRHEPTPQPTCVSPCRPRLIIIIIIIITPPLLYLFSLATLQIHLDLFCSVTTNRHTDHAQRHQPWL